MRNSIRWALAVLAILFWIAIPKLVFAHNWYDPACCSTQDCAPIDPSHVTITPEGYRINLRPGDHPMVESETSLVVPYDSPKIRIQMYDTEYHPCIRFSDWSGSHSVICLYIPYSGG